MTFRRTREVTLLRSAIAVLVVGTLCNVQPSAAAKKRVKLRWFTSSAGGYQVRVPASWHIEEEYASGHYSAELGSPEAADGSGFGINVTRVHDYSANLTTSSTHPRGITEEYVYNTLCGEPGRPRYGAMDSVQKLPTTAQDRSVFERHVEVSFCTPEQFTGRIVIPDVQSAKMQTFSLRLRNVELKASCRLLRVSIGVKGKELFAAFLEAPCGAFLTSETSDGHDRIVGRIVESLSIRKSWEHRRK